MFSDKLFELAFNLQRTKLWKMLWTAKFFAVSLPDGEIGYCSHHGAIGGALRPGPLCGEKD